MPLLDKYLSLGLVAAFFSVSTFAGNTFDHDKVAPELGSTNPITAKSNKQNTRTKLTLGLAALSDEYQAFKAQVAQGKAVAGQFATRRTMANVINETVVIDAVAANDPQALAQALEALGAQVTGIAGRIVSAKIPLAQLPLLEGVVHLQFARPALAMRHSGAVTSQGDRAQASDQLRANLGVTGKGALVGILSDSFDCLGGGYAADVASGDLPDSVNILAESPWCQGSDEGRAMAQILYDVAPGAGLAFHTAENGEAAFANGILKLAAQGSTIIVDDIIYFAEPMFQDGVIAQAVDTVHAAGIPYFSSAGNEGRQSYEAPFRRSGVFVDVGKGAQELHDFDPGEGVDTWQEFRGSSIISFQWDQPFFSVSGPPGAGADIDICISKTPNTDGLISCSNEDNAGRDPLEFIYLYSGNSPAYIAILHGGGSYPARMKYVWFNYIYDLEYDTHSPTAYGHANAAGAMAVGAAAYFQTPAFGADRPLLNSYSSAGGIPILFDSAGQPTYELREKPEFTAPDGGNNTFFGYDYEPDNWPNFFGTSSSAPHAAGVAALLREFKPNLPPADIKRVLQASAIDIRERETADFGPPNVPLGGGFDNDSGAGLLDARSALNLLIATANPIPTLPSIAMWLLIGAIGGVGLKVLRHFPRQV